MSSETPNEVIRPPHVAFRCDASLTIGSGHVMRCLTLANALRAKGAHCSFVARNLPGNINSRISGLGFRVDPLGSPTTEGKLACQDSASCHWLGVSIEQEIEESYEVIGQIDPDIVIVDHYGIDYSWHQRATADRLVMVIDDLADRQYACQLLLDQNFGRRAKDYDDLVSTDTRCLIGPKYALLRPEFENARNSSLARCNAVSKPLRLLISMGGMDSDNSTGQILDVVAKSKWIKDISLVIVFGEAAPHSASVHERVEFLSLQAKVVSDVSDMAGLLMDIDLAIGAAGGSVWERCCLGVPSLLLSVAENQRPAARALHEAGLAVSLGDLGAEGWQAKIDEALWRFLHTDELSKMSMANMELVDGHGAKRVADCVLACVERGGAAC